MSKEEEVKDISVSESVKENESVTEEVNEKEVSVKEIPDVEEPEAESEESVEDATSTKEDAEVKDNGSAQSSQRERKEKPSEKIRREISEGIVPDFNKRQVINADMDTKRELYQQGEIANPLGIEETSSYERDLRREYEFLYEKTRAIPPVPVNGKISGTTMFGKNDIPMFKVITDGFAGIYTILIPVDEMYECRIDKPDEELEKGMKDWVGAKISFCPIKVLEKEKLCFASRLRAMEVQAYDNYKKIRQSGVPHIVKGKIVTGRIVATLAKKVIVDVCGADAEIEYKELDWIRRGTVYVNAMYKQNNPINVLIQNIEEKKVRTKQRRASDAYNVMAVKASARLAKDNPNETYWENYKVGNIVIGRVVSKSETDMTILIEEKVEAYSGIPRFMEDINKGDEVKCVIIKMDEADHFIQVNILAN